MPNALNSHEQCDRAISALRADANAYRLLLSLALARIADGHREIASRDDQLALLRADVRRLMRE